MAKELKIGITQSGIKHAAEDPMPDLDTQFRMVKESGVYDYLDKTPSANEVDDYLACSEKYDLPIRAGGWFYTIGKDEPLLRQNLEIGKRLGSNAHNTQIGTYHAEGHMVTDEEVADCYMEFSELGESLGCLPTFEIHVNMWSEDFSRVSRVADIVESRGATFRMTLDHSHVIFKIDNPEEQEIQDIRPKVESGELILDPFVEGNVCDEWIQRGFIWHAHARAAAPNGPKNFAYQNEDGSYGRGIQYPFIQPAQGEWHGDWDEAKLEPWKEVVRHLLDYHAQNEDSPLLQISTEFIPFPDYGAGSKYSNFEHSMACAQWMRDEWIKRANG